MASEGDEPSTREQTPADGQNESSSEEGNTWYFSVNDEVDDDEDEDYQDAPDEMEDDDFDGMSPLQDPTSTAFYS